MSIVRWNPWGELETLQDDLERALRGAPAGRGFVPATDVRETAEGFELTMDLPGVKLEDVRIEVTDRVLEISGARQDQTQAAAEGYRRIERRSGAFTRSFTLGKQIDEAGITAKMADGVLQVKLPKRAEVQPRRIVIEA
jgi:HSP20 family protein